MIYLNLLFLSQINILFKFFDSNSKLSIIN